MHIINVLTRIDANYFPSEHIPHYVLCRQHKAIHQPRLVKLPYKEVSAAETFL